MLARDIASYEAASLQSGAVYFDRGIPDAIGYLTLEGLPVPAEMHEAAARRRYNRRVFIAPPWPEIFTQDTERKQTPAEAERTYHAMVATYAACDYELVELPRTSVAGRVRVVRAHRGV
jgi:predicted ATPase